MDDRNVVDAMHRLELIRRMRIQTMLRGTDAHRGQGPILDYIETHPRCTQAEAAESLGVSPPSITCSVRRMENAGLIVKTTDEKDMRCTRLELTEKGRENHKKVKAAFKRLDGEMFEGISDEDKQKLIELYSRMAANLYKAGASIALVLAVLVCILVHQNDRLEALEKRTRQLEEQIQKQND